MAVLQYRTLSNRTVATLSVERDMVFWDRELTGFGVRVSLPNDVIVAFWRRDLLRAVRS